MAAAPQSGCEAWGLVERLWICACAGAPLGVPVVPLGIRSREFRMPALGQRALAWVHHWAQPHPRALQASSACTPQCPQEMGWPEPMLTG